MITHIYIVKWCSQAVTTDNQLSPLHVIPKMCCRLRMWNALSLFWGPEGPRFTALQECGKNTGTVHCHLGVGGEFAQLTFLFTQAFRQI